MPTIKQYKQNGRDCVVTHYDSIAEMDNDCLVRPYARPDNADKRRRLDARSEVYGSLVSWYGVSSLDEVKRILREGYSEGAAKVDALYEAIAPKLPRAVDFRRKPVRAAQGDSLDIHAVLRGNLDKAWTTTKRRANTGTGLVRIAVDICGNCHVRADQLQWRGIAALALSRAMTKAGYSVEIVAGQAGSNGMRNKPQLVGTITVTVKPRHAVLDAATLAASICMPGFFRYLGFASIIRQAEDMGCDVTGGLGSSVKLESVLPVPEKVAQVIVPETVNDRESAERWIVESLTLLQGATVAREGR